MIDKITKIDREDIAKVLDIVGIYFDTEAIADITEIYIDLENEEIEIRGFGG
jgi:hypothetical protein